MPALVCQLLYSPTVLFKVLYCKILNINLCLLFMYYLCRRYYKLITAHYYIADHVSWVPRLTLLNLTREMGVSVLHPDISHHHLADPFEISSLNEEGKEQ